MLNFFVQLRKIPAADVVKGVINIGRCLMSFFGSGV